MLQLQKKGTLSAKRKLPNARDYKGGKAEMKKKKVVFDKATKEEKRKLIAANFPGIDIVKELKNGPCKHYNRYNARIRSGGKWNEETCDDEILRLSKCHS